MASENSNGAIIKTFDHQSKLPRLPIPNLENTLRKYQETLRPLLTPEELKKADQIIQDFLLNLGPRLQSRLVHHDSTQQNSWLENWWYQLAYLTWRVPLMINSNWWMNIRDDHLPPVMEMARVPHGPGKFSFVQLRRAACIISNLLDYKDLLDAEKIPPEMARSTPLCMDQFRHLFGVTRIAEPGCDRLQREFPCLSNHVCVMLQDQVFVLAVYDASHQRIALNHLEASLTAMVHHVTTLPIHDRQPPIGILTAAHRDTWAKAREQLRQLSTKNQEGLAWIESSLFVVSMDDVAAGPYTDLHHRWMAHGVHGHNRWFDKSINLIVTSSGQAGCCGEHAPQDAVTPTTLFEHALLREKETFLKASQTPMAQSPLPSSIPLQPIHWRIDANLNQTLDQAELNNRALIKATDICLLMFTEYGADWIKRQSFSPDAYIQMVMQLAYFRMHGHVTSTYETASTRSFLHGRTETCRSCSVASKRFVETFENPSMPVSEKQRCLKEAMHKHVGYLRMASQGEGVDRHLLGLRMVKRKDDGPCPLFDDPLFQKSSEWRLSTSNLSPVCYKVFRGTGFGAVHPDGYGINYFLGPKQIHFGLAAHQTSTATSCDLLRVHLVAALRDMKGLMEGSLESASLISKL